MKAILKVHLLFLLALVLAGLGLCGSAGAQTYTPPNINSGCPGNCRMIPWQAGSDLWNGGVLPNYTSVTCTGLAGDGTTNDGPKIQACITAAAANTAVSIPAGTYYVNTELVLKSYVVLRGAEPEIVPSLPNAKPAATTLIIGTAAAPFTTTNFSSGGSPGNLSPPTPYNTFPSTCGLTGTPQKGDTQVTISSNSGACVVASGSWLEVYGNDDPTLIRAYGSENQKCEWCGNNNGYYVQIQIVQITSLAGNVATLSRPLYYTPYTPSVTVDGNVEPAGAKYTVITPSTYKAGFENMRINGSGYDIAASPIILLRGCWYCWVQGVETYDTGGDSGSAHIEMDFSYADEIRSNVLHDQRSGASGAGYGVYFQFVSSDTKVEDNIIFHNRHGIVFQGGGSGVAVLYNYIDDEYTDDLTYLGSARTSHGAHPFMDLFEGNIISHIAADDFWGTSSHDLFFRNWLWGDETNHQYTGGITIPSFPPNNGYEAANLYTGQTYYSFVNNVLGHPSGAPWSTGGNANYANATLSILNCISPGGGNTNCDGEAPATPAVYEFGGTLTLDGGNVPSSASTVLLVGNYDFKTRGIASNNLSGYTFPSSYYYTSTPAFITNAGCPFPEQGSDLTTIGSLQQPAYQRAMGGACTGGSTPSNVPRALTGLMISQ